MKIHQSHEVRRVRRLDAIPEAVEEQGRDKLLCTML